MSGQYYFPDLHAPVRSTMLAEVDRDTVEGVLYFSKDFNDEGRSAYPSTLRTAVMNHDEGWLSQQLEGAFNDYSTTGKRVRYDANRFFAGNEFNRFYIRGVCLVAIDQAHGGVEVYRARQSSRARSESEAMLGQVLNPQALLDDLRARIGTRPELLPQIGSGLSVRLLADAETNLE